ncbi:MAG: c-type cytochrome [Anaerolineales bacterium]|jgi:cytochrome c553
MKKVLKWIGIVLGGLVALLLVAAVVLYILGSARLNKTYDIQPEAITIPTDEAAIARGRHLVEAVTFCKECHGQQLEGDVFEDEPMIGTFYAPNLTSGRGGEGAAYSDADYVRAIRHGVDPQGRGLMIMHSDVYHNISQQDLGAIIAYLKSVPPVDNELPEPKIYPLGNIMVALGMFDSEALPLIPAEKIDHSASFVEMPAQGATAEYGSYLVSITLCHMCHGPELTGGPPLEEGMMAAPDITPRGELGLTGWSEADFVQTLRTGVSPSGHKLDPEIMPWKTYANLTDQELAAIYRYIQSLGSE